MADRFAWFWMLAEPIAHVVLFIAVRELLGRIRLVAGAEFIPWLLVGMIIFFMFRDGMLRSLGAIDANRGLFSYRQVKPVDTVIARAVVEGVLKSFVFLLLIIGFSIFGIDLVPYNPVGVFRIWVMAWAFGLGAGLFFSVANSLVSEVGIIIRMLMLPLYFLSGVIIPLNFLPHDVQVYVLYNPALHLVELVRGFFFESYRPIQGVSEVYVIWWTLIMALLGLAMHARFEFRVKAA